MKILLTYPVSTCVAEQSFSSMMLKTPFHSTMTEERMSYLALLHIQKNKKVDIEEAVNVFAIKKKNGGLYAFNVQLGHS